jgi:CRP-like cAMP-binding protein
MQAEVQTRRPTDGIAASLRTDLWTRSVLDRFEPFSCTVVVARAQAVRRQDEPAEFCWRILSGCVRTVAWSGGGHRQIGAFLWPGDLLGIDDSSFHCSDAEAVTGVVLRRYPRRMIETAAQFDTELALWLLTMTARELSCARQHIAMLGRKTAISKVAAFLLALDRGAPLLDQRFVELPMSRSDIADHLGMSAETVCRNLMHLQHLGTVRLSPSGIDLRDRAGLLKLAVE